MTLYECLSLGKLLSGGKLDKLRRACAESQPCWHLAHYNKMSYELITLAKGPEEERKCMLTCKDLRCNCHTNSPSHQHTLLYLMTDGWEGLGFNFILAKSLPDFLILSFSSASFIYVSFNSLFLHKIVILMHATAENEKC